MSKSNRSAVQETADHAHRHLDRMVAALRSQLEAERAKGIPTAAEVEELIASTAEELEALRSKQAKAKARCKQRKHEIVDWQQWSQGLESGDKPEQLLQMQNEVAWRQQEIHALEQEIADSYAVRLEIEGRLEALASRLMAIQAGLYDRAIEEDPRLRELIAERDHQKRAKKAVRQ